jgi:hypothetical protein
LTEEACQPTAFSGRHPALPDEQYSAKKSHSKVTVFYKTTIF